MVLSNLAYNLISHIFYIGIYFLFAPIIINLFGIEAGGLLTLSISFLALSAIAELGLTQSGVLIHSDFYANKLSRDSYESSLSSIKSIYFVSLLITFLLCSAGFYFFSEKLLTYETLSEETVQKSLFCILSLLLLRVAEFFFRMFFVMHENFKSIAKITIVYTLLKFFPGLLICYHFGLGVEIFFSIQLFFGLLMLFNFIYSSRKYYSEYKIKIISPINAVKSLKNYFQTITILSIAACIHAISMQVDRLVVSSVFSLEEFGYFSLAVLGATLIISLSTPIFTTFFPRISKLVSSSDTKSITNAYDSFLVLATTFLGFIATFLFIFGESVLLLWTNDAYFVSNFLHIFRIYIVGNLFYSISIFTYQIQLASNNLKYHFYFSILKNVIFVIGTLFSSLQYNFSDAIYVIAVLFLVLNLIEFTFYTRFILLRFLSNYTTRFFILFTKCLAPSIFTITLFKFLFSSFWKFDNTLISLFTISILSLLIVCLINFKLLFSAFKVMTKS